MALTSNKFEHMRYGNFNSSDVAHLSSVSAPIKEMELVRDLGVVMSFCGDFEEHISEHEGKTDGWIDSSHI